MDKKTESNRPKFPDSDTSRRWRMRHDWDDYIQDLIEDGRRRGEFDNLPGKGKPLDLDTNPFEGNMALANKLLKDNDLLPAWLQQRVGLDEAVSALRTQISQTWARYQPAFDHAVGDIQQGGLTLGWDQACRGWQSEIDALNKKIEGYNLRRPGQTLEIFKLELDRELRRIDAPRYLLSKEN